MSSPTAASSSPAPSTGTAPGMGLRRRENTRARLLEAALDVFAEKGVRRVTVDDLVQAAGFTRGAFYSNFTSLDEVFFALFENQAARMLTAVRDVIASVPEGEFSLDSLRLILESLHPFGRRWYLIQTEFVLLALRNEEAREVYDEHTRRFHAELVEVIGDIITRLGRAPAIPLEQMTETAVALYMHSLAEEHLGTGTLGPDELLDIVLPQVILGLSRPLD